MNWSLHSWTFCSSNADAVDFTDLLINLSSSALDCRCRFIVFLSAPMSGAWWCKWGLWQLVAAIQDESDSLILCELCSLYYKHTHSCHVYVGLAKDDIIFTFNVSLWGFLCNLMEFCGDGFSSRRPKHLFCLDFVITRREGLVNIPWFYFSFPAGFLGTFKHLAITLVWTFKRNTCSFFNICWGTHFTTRTTYCSFITSTACCYCATCANCERSWGKSIGAVQTLKSTSIPRWPSNRVFRVANQSSCGRIPGRHQGYWQQWPLQRCRPSFFCFC